MATLFLTFQALTTAESVWENSFFSMMILPVISITMCRIPLCALSLLSIFVLLTMFLVDAINFLGTTPGGNF